MKMDKRQINNKRIEAAKVQANTLMNIAFKMSRQYRSSFPPVGWQFSKVFNRGMGSLAFMRAVPEEKVVLVNKNLANKAELRRIGNLLKLFRGWRLVEVRLGYPEWYSIRDLYYVYKK